MKNKKFLIIFAIVFISSLIIIHNEKSKSCFEFERETGTILEYNGPKDVVIPKRILGVKVRNIYFDAFRDKGLESVVIPDTVEKIGMQSFCENNLTSIVIPHSVVEIGVSAFSDNHISSVEIPKSVKTIGSFAFYKNDLKSAKISENLEKIIVNSWEDEKDFTLENLKERCVFYGDVDIEYKGETYNLKDINDGPDFVFHSETQTITDYQFSAPKDVVIPETIDGVTVKIIGEDAFSDKDIESVILPQELYKIEYQAFEHNNIKEIELPKRVTYVGENAFASNQIKNLKLNNRLKYIEKDAFYSNDIDFVEIPSSVEYMSFFAFSWNDDIKISFYKPDEYKIVFKNYYIFLTEKILNIDGTIYITPYEFMKFFGGKLDLVDKKKVYILNEKVIDKDIIIKRNGLEYIPIRKVCELAGYKVNWDGLSKMVYIK